MNEYLRILAAKFKERFLKSAKLEAAIKKNLEGLGYSE
jgi:hypothetical protein